jgi:hypothetical protein
LRPFVKKQFLSCATRCDFSHEDNPVFHIALSQEWQPTVTFGHLARRGGGIGQKTAFPEIGFCLPAAGCRRFRRRVGLTLWEKSWIVRRVLVG